METAKNQIDYGSIDAKIKERYRLKKKVNLVISIFIVISGLAATYMAFVVELGVTAFLHLTNNGTLFTTAGGLIFVAATIYELTTGREITNVKVYFIRLSCAVTEAVIMLVVLIAFILGDPSGYDKWNQFITHIVIPVLTVSSFITNDAPIGRVTPLQRFSCTVFITVYSIMILALFGSGILPMDMIPYTYIDWRSVPVWQIAGYVGIVYLIAFTIATVLYRLNLKLSWLWFRKLTKRGINISP